MEFMEIPVRELAENACSLIGDKWALITAGDAAHCNMMTASWGGLGVLWGKEVAFIFVRPTRYTYTLIEQQNTFSLSFFLEGHREALNLCGSVSGRDTDKWAASGLTPAFDEDTPYVAQADLVLLCEKLYAQDITPDSFMDPSIAKWYHHDYHRVYVGAIRKALRRS